jgi:hypothetical protein
MGEGSAATTWLEETEKGWGKRVRRLSQAHERARWKSAEPVRRLVREMVGKMPEVSARQETPGDSEAGGAEGGV